MRGRYGQLAGDYAAGFPLLPRATSQTARLAPLTLLVGENSTGKTSFLAAVRAICEVAFRQREPDFREPPI